MATSRTRSNPTSTTKQKKTASRRPRTASSGDGTPPALHESGGNGDSSPGIELPDRPPPVGERPTEPAVRLAVSFARVMDTHDEIQTLVQDRLRTKAPDAVALSKRATDAFAEFRPSRLTEAERSQGIYLPTDDGLEGEAARAKFAEAMGKAQAAGVENLQASQDKRKLRLQFGERLRKNKELEREGNTDDDSFFVGLVPFVAVLGALLTERPPLAKDPVVTQCQAEARAAEMMSKVGVAPQDATDIDDATPGGQPESDTDEATPGERPENGAGPRPRARAMVRGQVHTQMSTTTSPEEMLQVNVETRRATLSNTEHAVDTFQLRKGASDVTSYHDFNSLNLAFEHVWTELFDADLAALGIDLYKEAVKLEEFSRPGQETKIDLNLTSIADIKKLMASIIELSGLPPTAARAPVETLPPGTREDLAWDDPDESGIPASDEEWEAHKKAWKQLEEAAYQASVTAVPDAIRLSRLLAKVAALIQGNYAFKVFKEGSWNFGFLVTYRQTWVPESYQVGDLVSTLPLAPKETRRYTTKRVVKKTRSEKALEDSLRTTKSESSGTSRVEREIVDKAHNKTDFDANTHGSFGAEGSYKNDYTVRAGGESGSNSERVKKAFHEAVLKSAEDYKQQHRMEIDTAASEETEETTFHEVSNPNDELTVTYMFYELQRRFRVSEHIHHLTPVILLANKVPSPHEIDDAWLTEHDWILRRVILDDSFRPALDYLTKSFVGAELNIQILQTNAKAQKKVADEIRDELRAQIATLDAARKDWSSKVDAQAGAQITEGILTSVKKVFDPFNFTGNKAVYTAPGFDTIVDYAQETVDRAERERARLIDALAAATNVLQVAVDKFAAAVKEHHERVSEIDRLRLHVKDNIIYYMQAIWSHEPADQRFFRVFDKQISVPEVEAAKVEVTKRKPDPIEELSGKQKKLPFEAALPVKLKGVKTKQMSEIADLDTVLGYKGNYAIYPLLDNNFITLSMMLDYLEFSDEVVSLRDPDAFADYTVADLLDLADCMKRHDKDAYEDHLAEEIKDLVVQRLLSGRSEDDRVIVPTDSLYLEALVGTHPLLEDFKLLHRSLDVKKVQAEVRHAELENIRLAARALRGNDEDPDIERKIIIEGAEPSVVIEPGTN